MADKKQPYDQVDYNSYLKIPELIDLQHPLTEPEAHDELLFIIIHQAYELWFKQILFELDSVAVAVHHDDTFEATRLLRRVHKIQNLLVHQIHILETMTPRDFLSFRSALNPASGFQSLQFREVEFVSGMKSEAILASMERYNLPTDKLRARYEAPSLRERFYALLQRNGLEVAIPPDGDNPVGDDLDRTIAELQKIYERPENFFNLYSLGEALVTLDQNLLLWRFHHIRVVERLIGSKMGTGGSAGVGYLETTLTKRAFPMLWYVRGTLSDEVLYGTTRGPTTIA